LVSEANPTGWVRLVGEVVDFTGSRLQIRVSGSVVREVPGKDVLRIETVLRRSHESGNAAFAAGKFDEAIRHYQAARREETRAWVRRQIAAQIVMCYQNLDRFVEAGSEFLTLVEEDPQTPHFACIPLSWLVQQAPPDLEVAAQGWLQQQKNPAAQLLGASHLLTGREGPAALNQLRLLARGAPEPIRTLALAQSWRLQLATADPVEKERWEKLTESLPTPLRAGPYAVIAQAWEQRAGWDQAALAWLRVVLLEKKNRPLIARALLGAGRAMEQLARLEEAAEQYRRIVHEFPDRPETREAQERLESLSKTLSPTSGGKRG